MRIEEVVLRDNFRFTFSAINVGKVKRILIDYYFRHLIVDNFIYHYASNFFAVSFN